MALAKITVIDKREILEDGSIQVRHATYITEDGVRITEPTYHRSSFVPGQDVTKEDAMVRRIAAAEWTPDVIAAHDERVAEAQALDVKVKR